MKRVINPLRTILYILFAVGGILVVLALSMVFLDHEGAQIKPQSETIELETSEIVQGGTQTNEQLMASTKTVSKPQSQGIQPDAEAKSLLKIDIARVKPDGAAVLLVRQHPMQRSVFLKVKSFLAKLSLVLRVNG